jgi:hypothetical protein
MLVAAAVIGAIRIIIIVVKAIEGIVVHIMTIRTTLVDMDRTVVLRNDITAAIVRRFQAMEGTVGEIRVRNRNILFR